MEIHNWLLLIFEYHYVCTFLIIFAEARIFDDILFGTGLFPEYELVSLNLLIFLMNSKLYYLFFKFFFTKSFFKEKSEVETFIIIN